MANVIEERGLFWWFKQSDGHTNTRETSVSGVLAITREGDITLVLEGPLWYSKTVDPVPWGEPRPLPENKWITGILSTAEEVGQFGGHVLLCGLKRTELPLEGKPQTYESSLCVTNDSPFSESFDLVDFDQLRVELVGLEDWLNLDSIRVSFEATKDDDVEVMVRYKNHRFLYEKPHATISIESLTLGAPVFSFSDLSTRDATFRQINYLVYTPSTASSFDSLRYAFGQIEEFFALLLGSYFRLDWPTMVLRREEFAPWYRVYYFRGSAPEYKISRYFTWTSFHKVRASFGDLFGAWQAQVEQYGAGCYLYLAALRNPLPYSEHTFVNLIWALEALHRKKPLPDVPDTPSAVGRRTRIQSIRERLAGVDDVADWRWFEDRALDYQRSPTLADRILDLLSTLPISLDESALRVFSMRCAQRRNEISHEGGPREQESYLEFHRDLGNLAEALSYLYHALLLHEIGFDAKSLVEAMTEGGLAEMRLLPALQKVGLDIPKPTKSH